jgi:hypothetical protein
MGGRLMLMTMTSTFGRHLIPSVVGEQGLGAEAEDLVLCCKEQLPHFKLMPDHCNHKGCARRWRILVPSGLDHVLGKDRVVETSVGPA